MSERTLLSGEGREAEVYLEADGRVLKLMRHPDELAKVERERDVCQLLVANGHSAPRTYDIVVVDGRPGLLMERIEGGDLLGNLQRSPTKVGLAARVLAETHADLHEQIAPAGLPDLNDKLAEAINRAPNLPPELKEQVLAVLRGLPRGDRLCHRDFHLGNMMGPWSDPVVIDWAHAARGDPTSDVARTELLHRRAALPADTPWVFKVIAGVGRRVLTNQYLAHYRRRRSIDATLRAWRFVHMAARMDEDIPEEEPMLLRLLRKESARGVGQRR